MRSADTPFTGGPLDGRVLPVLLGPFESVPRTYRVPVPAHGDRPAVTHVYRRVKEYDAHGRRRWRYVHDARTGGDESEGAGAPAAGEAPGAGHAPGGGDGGPGVRGIRLPRFGRAGRAEVTGAPASRPDDPGPRH